MSYAPDLADVVGYGLSRVAAVERVSDGVRVTTHCMYPSNGLVQVTVRGGAETIVASDEGGGFDEAASAGVRIAGHHYKSLGYLIKDQGLLTKDGIVFTRPLPLEVAPVAVLHVANASQEIARWFFDHAKIKRSRDFKMLLAEFMKKSFDDRVGPAIIVGHSNKAHKFANVLKLTSNRRLIVDPVLNDPSAINSRVVANLDVRANNDPSIEQRIVYDDEDSWSAADLNLLRVGATVVPFSRSAEVIKRLANG